jgi:hypothetical protein
VRERDARCITGAEVKRLPVEDAVVALTGLCRKTLRGVISSAVLNVGIFNFSSP